MKLLEFIFISACLINLVKSLPVPDESVINDETPSLDPVAVDENTYDQITRSKRALSILQRFFPNLYQNAEEEVNNEVQQEEAAIEHAGSEHNEVRVPYEDVDEAANEAVESELSPLDVGDDENRNKRSGALDGNSNSGGSGNFIFDIIRLVTNSGASLSSGSKDQSSTSGKTETDEAVPGPATRFLVIANRGLSNLIQDLILRVAATSERFVNFKARLITSII